MGFMENEARIAALEQKVPALVVEADRLRAENEALRALADTLRGENARRRSAPETFLALWPRIEDGFPAHPDVVMACTKARAALAEPTSPPAGTPRPAEPAPNA